MNHHLLSFCILPAVRWEHGVGSAWVQCYMTTPLDSDHLKNFVPYYEVTLRFGWNGSGLILAEWNSRLLFGSHCRGCSHPITTLLSSPRYPFSWLRGHPALGCQPVLFMVILGIPRHSLQGVSSSAFMNSCRP
jgi:hypothetical protein